MVVVDGDFLTSEINEQLVNDAGQWLTAGPVSPTVELKNHAIKTSGYVSRKVSHRYKVNVDHDACVASAFPDTNYGSNDTLGVRESSGPQYVHVYIKSTSINTFTSKHTLDKGYLVLKRLGAGNIATTKMDIQRVSGADWDESTITWNTKPALDASTLTTVSMQTLANITDDTIAFVNSNPDTITDSNNNFLDRRFIDKEQIIVTGSASNDGTYTVNTATAGTLTLIDSDSLTPEAAGSTVTIVQDKWIAIEITSWIQNWLDGTWNNYGVALTPFDADTIKLFRSSEYAIAAARPFFLLFYFPYD